VSDGIRYTNGEQAARVADAARGCWRIVRGKSTARIDAADERRAAAAAERTDRERLQYLRTLAAVKDEVAAATVAVRTSRGTEKRAARDTLRDAQQRLRVMKSAGRKFGC
jgi:hypothetical protein